MTEFAKWQDDNARYLENAIGQLRSLLEGRAGRMHNTFLAPPPAPPPPPPEKPKSGWRLFRRRAQPDPEESNAAASPANSADPPESGWRPARRLICHQRWSSWGSGSVSLVSSRKSCFYARRWNSIPGLGFFAPVPKESQAGLIPPSRPL